MLDQEAVPHLVDDSPTGDVEVSDFSLVLPADWVRLSLDAHTDLSIVRLVNRQLETVPQQERENLRAPLTRRLRHAADDARAAGGVDLLLALGQVRGVPLGSSCLVTALPLQGADLTGQLEAMADDGATYALVEVGGRSAVRREIRTPDPVGAEGLGALQDDLQGLVPAGADLPSAATTRVDFFVPVPPGQQHLLFSFSCSVDPLAASMTRLFDAIMGTLRWVR